MTDEQKKLTRADRVGTWKKPLKYEPYERDAQKLAEDIFLGLHPEQYTEEQRISLEGKILVFSRMITSLAMAYAERNMEQVGLGQVRVHD